MGAGSDAQLVTLGLGDEIFAVPVILVREILDFKPPFAIPEGPAYLLGLIDVRGRATPMLDLRIKLGRPAVPPTPDTRILVVDVSLENRVLSLGLVADRVIEVVTIKDEDLHAPPDIGVRWRSEYIEGVFRQQDGFVVMFDLARLLTSQEADALSEEYIA